MAKKMKRAAAGFAGGRAGKTPHGGAPRAVKAAAKAGRGVNKVAKAKVKAGVTATGARNKAGLARSRGVAGSKIGVAINGARNKSSVAKSKSGVSRTRVTTTGMKNKAAVAAKRGVRGSKTAVRATGVKNKVAIGYRKTKSSGITDRQHGKAGVVGSKLAKGAVKAASHKKGIAIGVAGAAAAGGAVYAYKRRQAKKAASGSTYKRKLKSGKTVVVRKGRR